MFFLVSDDVMINQKLTFPIRVLVDLFQFPNVRFYYDKIPSFINPPISTIRVYHMENRPIFDPIKYRLNDI